jgi:SAM-dependent methyltransferase
VLDVGCGRPTFLEALVRAAGVCAVGTDVSDAGWTADRARWDATGLELRQGQVSAAGLEGPFDLVCMWHSLEHDYAPVETLTALRALTRPGGALLIEVPNFDSLTRRLQGSRWAGFHTPRHTAVYTPKTLGALLERCGWAVERQATHGTLDPYVLWWLGTHDPDDLESAFPGFMLGKLLTLPVAALARWMSLGVQVAVARPGKSP